VTRYVTGCIGHIGIAPLPDTGRRHIGNIGCFGPDTDIYRYIIFIGIPMYTAGPALHMPEEFLDEKSLRILGHTRQNRATITELVVRS
jgi:hypothetical protein